MVKRKRANSVRDFFFGELIQGFAVNIMKIFNPGIIANILRETVLCIQKMACVNVLSWIQNIRGKEDKNMIILKFVSLVLAIWFSIVNIGRIYCKQSVSITNLFIQAVSITTFVFIQFKLF
jgi:hypothetical protein